MQAEATIKIARSSREVFNTINDFGSVHQWNPYVRTVDLLSENNGGLGSERICYFYDGQELHEKITGFNDGAYIDVNLINPPFPVTNMIAKLKVDEEHDNLSRVTMSFEYKVKFGVLGKLMNSMMIKSQFVKTGERVLKGLSEKLLNNNYVGRGGKVISEDEFKEEQLTRPNAPVESA